MPGDRRQGGGGRNAQQPRLRSTQARGDYDTALRYLEASLAIAVSSATRRGRAQTLNNLGHTSQARGDYDTALRYLEASLAISRGARRQGGGGHDAQQPRHTIYHAQGDYDAAVRYLEASLAISREIGDKVGLVTTLHSMGILPGRRRIWSAQ